MGNRAHRKTRPTRVASTLRRKELSMSADAMSYGGQGFSGVEPSPLVFPDDAARRRLRTSCALGIGALIVLVGGFILTEVAAAGVGAHHGADGGLGMLAGLLLTPVPLAMYSLILSVRSLRSRFGMRVDAGGRDGDAELVVLDLGGNTDSHGSTSVAGLVCDG